MTLQTLVRSWRKDRRGAAAVEMALVAPFLAIVVAGIVNFAPQLDHVHRMRDAVTSGANYVMSGGTDATTIQNVTFSAWTGHVQADSVNVTQWCTCAGVTSSCSTLCADNTVPQGFTKIAASTTYSSANGPQVFNAQDTVRTR
ncbi:MAG TPA: TadE/TadG family type IV pilus assembly protein [Caulobacteraceae bacterium]|nr:TadE/TadG family type IV pilus assembly protein [Caulobacteraceae bacterium]